MRLCILYTFCETVQGTQGDHAFHVSGAVVEQQGMSTEEKCTQIESANGHFLSSRDEYHHFLERFEEAPHADLF